MLDYEKIMNLFLACATNKAWLDIAQIQDEVAHRIGEDEFVFPPDVAGRFVQRRLDAMRLTIASALHIAGVEPMPIDEARGVVALSTG